ncbi:MAG TPA: YicC/YloC family endoribonuclease [Verrucomicrobiae bacterium]|jgi:uncharacterized protein (TIGR00255 family)
MKSMTGYGRGECSRDGFKVTVEISSVNRKQTEISVNLPRELEVLEAQIRDDINRRISRGRITTRVAFHTAENSEAGVHLNKALAGAYVRELNRLAADLSLSGSVSLDLLLRVPGVLQTNEEFADAEDFWPAVRKALGQALDTMLQMRTREGAHLAKDLQLRINAMRKSAVRVKRQAPLVQKRYRLQLIERVRSAGLENVEIDEDRLLKEVLFFADRSDISEEITRLESHFNQFDDCVKTDEPVGRTLDFLAQEMNREINTIGSKANDSSISREVVLLKTELEKFREQVQNVE